MSKLVTPSLFASIDWYKKAPSNWKDRANEDLNNLLARKKTPIAPAAKRGITFEDCIYKTLESKQEIAQVKCTEFFRAFLIACLDGKFQVKSKSFITINKVEYCLYGKLDVLLPDRIIDIKTTSKWDGFSEDKYLGSMQHIIYLFNEKMNHFEYLIAVFDGKESNTIKKIKRLVYKEELIEKLRGKIIIEIENQNAFLKEYPKFYDLYHKTYSQY